MRITIDKIRIDKTGTYLTTESLPIGVLGYNRRYKIKIANEIHKFQVIEMVSAFCREEVIVTLEQVYYEENFNKQDEAVVNKLLGCEDFELIEQVERH